MTHDAEPQAAGFGAPAGVDDRRWLIGYADRLLAGARRHASPGHARICPPGPEGGYGAAVDGLEGFTRTLLLAGFRIAGERGSGVDELIDFYARGIATGVDPASPERWVRPDEHGQAKVEAAAIALILDLTRPWLWETLAERTQQQVVDYLAPVVGDPGYPRNNWIWFRIVTETFLRSVGGPWSQADIEQDLALHESFQRADGWASDGDERAFDHYVGWVFHLYPALWARMSGATDLVGERRSTDIARLDDYLQAAIALVGADGAPLFQGRTLIYRFAAAAPFWAGVLSEVPSLSLGLLRHAACSIVGHFATRGIPDENGLLTMGWYHPWRQLAQAYSGPSSPYWASKGLLGVMFPADHPVWAAPAEPLPLERGDVLRAITAPGWVVSGTHADGIVRVVNHGTDRALAGTLVGDSPLHARIGYSTVTAPLLDDRAWVEPLEQSVVIVDPEGRATHRAAMVAHPPYVEDGVAVAGSTTVAHWLAPDPGQEHHGSGFTGRVQPVGRLTVVSLVRGPWEVRLACVDDLPAWLEPETLRLRFGGWPVATNTAAECPANQAAVADAELRSRLLPLLGDGEPAVVELPDASPLGAIARVPILTFRLTTGSWTAVLAELTKAPLRDDTPPQVAIEESTAGPLAAVTWPDGRSTASRLAISRLAAGRTGDGQWPDARARIEGDS